MSFSCVLGNISQYPLCNSADRRRGFRRPALREIPAVEGCRHVFPFPEPVQQGLQGGRHANVILHLGQFAKYGVHGAGAAIRIQDHDRHRHALNHRVREFARPSNAAGCSKADRCCRCLAESPSVAMLDRDPVIRLGPMSGVMCGSRLDSWRAQFPLLPRFNVVG